MMKKFAALLAGLLAASLAVVPAAAADEVTPPETECLIPQRAAVIDGVISEGEWDGATKLVLNISDTGEWAESGAGIVGTMGWLLHTDDDFTNELSFMADEDYIYICLKRVDSTLNFATDNYHTPYASDCSLMWFYDTEYTTQYGLQLLASDKSGNPHIGYFFMDADQSASVDLVADGNAEAKTVVTDNGYIMEAKVAYGGMDDLTLDMLKSGKVNVTYCAVNICEEGWDSDDGQHQLWGVENYQAQYLGVNYWDDAPKAIITDGAAPAAPETPAEEPAAPAEETPAASNGIQLVSGTPGFSEAEGPASLFDGNPDTKWCSDKGNFEVVWQMPEAVAVAGYQIVTAGDTATYPDRNPIAWTLSGSNDGENWTVVDTRTDDTTLEPVNLTPFDFTLAAVSPAYTYFKLDGITTGGNLIQISDFTLVAGEAPAAPAVEETEAPAAEETEAPAVEEVVEETVEETAPEAPQTFDAVIFAASAAVLSLAGYAVSKKR